MSNAMLSLLGMYQWDNSLFDDMTFPESFTQEAKTVFVNNLLMECAELEVLYSDWNFLKFAIKNWSEKEVISWNRYYAAMAAQYNPIQNYDRTELTTMYLYSSLYRRQGYNNCMLLNFAKLS